MRIIRMRIVAALGGVALALVLASCGPLTDGVFDLLVGPDRFGEDPGKPVYVPKVFVNWETPHVSPLDISPDGSRLFAVNTPDNRLEIFDLTGDVPISVGRVPVGLDPVTVRARTDDEVWVVNHISDSVSIVDTTLGNVVKTLSPGDEPTDVGFAAGRAFVVCSQLNQVVVYDLSDLDAPPERLAIAGEDPRALAVSPDGSRVVVAIFESGNGTTVIPQHVVSDPSSPYGGQNPIPTFDALFAEQIDALPPALPVALIVKKDPTGAWLDDNGEDWSAFVTWDLHDHDLAVIDAETLEVSYVRSLMNLNMQLAVRPDGQVTVVGTEAANHIRFEPNLTGRFVQSVIATVAPTGATPASIIDLNPHLAEAYASERSTVDPSQRALSIADPRGIVWTDDGQVAYVTGMGSNNVIRINATGNRLGQLDVGLGPTGLRFDNARNRLYVLNKFDATISVIDTADFSETARVELFDPTPAVIRDGRRFLYDARLTSGLGVTACGSCHIDGRMDQLAWDLGDPGGEIKPFNQQCDDFASSILGIECEDFHPLKGPMTTQTLQGIIGSEPLHWRGDKDNLADFNGAFISLDGSDRSLSDDEMARFEAFLSTIQFPPNPHRHFDNGLDDDVFGGNARVGRDIFINDGIDSLDIVRSGLLTCNRCHQLPTGTNGKVVPGRRLLTPQSAKVPHLRNLHEKTGFRNDSQTNNRGFGFTHAGEFPTVNDFLHFDVFEFGSGEVNDQRRRDVVAFVMSLSVDTHAGVGKQITLDGTNNDDPGVTALLDRMAAMADDGDLGLVVRGRQNDRVRGYAYVGGGWFQSDRAGEQITDSALRAAALEGSELTWTLVPLGSETRIGIDRDTDGVLDGDE